MKIRKKILSVGIVGTILVGMTACGVSTSGETEIPMQDEAKTGETAQAITEETTQPITEQSNDFVTNLEKIDMSKWQYHTDDNVYYQIGISYCETPADEKYETLAVFVPGAYFTGTENGDGTYTCDIDDSAKVNNYTAETAPIVMPVETPGYTAQAALVGATGDSALYDPYLEQIGAVQGVSDAVYGSMDWCPITNLDSADEAYEWMMGVTRSGLSAQEQDISDALAASFAEYINQAGIRDENGNILQLEESASGIYQAGSYYDYIVNMIEESLNNFLSDTEFPYDTSASSGNDGGMGGFGRNGRMGDFGGKGGMKTLAGIVSGYSDNLLLRAADVTLKERRKLVLVTRECPLGTLHLRNMYEASRLGAVIIPPVLSYYNHPNTLDDCTRHIAGKILDQFELEPEEMSRWS